MKWCALLSVCLCLAFGQTQNSVSGTYTYDANGVPALTLQDRAVTSGSGNSSTLLIPTLNGSLAPLEKVEEKVLTKTGTTKVVERIVTPYDSSGNPGPARKVVTTERKNPDGSTSVDVSSFRGDLNGQYQLTERETKVSRATGPDTSVFEKTVVRATLNGEEIIERQKGNVTTTKTVTKEDVSIERRDVNGSLQLAGRLLSEKQEKDGTVKDTSTVYEQDGAQLRLAKQTVSETQKQKDGSSLTKVDIFGAVSPGRADGGGLQFREQQIFEKSPGAGGSMKETFSIRRPTLDGGVLGPILKISERNCTGQCNTP